MNIFECPALLCSRKYIMPGLQQGGNREKLLRHRLSLGTQGRRGPFT